MSQLSPPPWRAVELLSHRPSKPVTLATYERGDRAVSVETAADNDLLDHAYTSWAVLLPLLSDTPAARDKLLKLLRELG